MNSGSWWWTGRPGVLWFMGSQRVGHDWVTELNWTEHPHIYDSVLFITQRGWYHKCGHICMYFTALDLASITSPIHNWVLFLLWLHPFILSEVISPLISSSILGTYQPGEFIFQCPIFLPFHTVHGVLKARILKWFAIPFSSGPHSVKTLHHDLSVLGGPTRHGLVSWS